MFLFNPRQPAARPADAATAALLEKTVRFFETKGKARLREDDLDRTWYADFLDFSRRERLFATFLTPARPGRARGPLGHQPQLRPQRGARLLRPALLVHLAGHHPRPRAHSG